MSEKPYFESPELMAGIYDLYRDFFDRAEKRRRWSLSKDIPWNQCNPSLNPAIAKVVQTFCAVELYLPDYVGKIMPRIRAIRGRAWFTFNWGYEESKHSLALGDWLIHSKNCTEEQMVDFENEVFEHEWNLPTNNVRGMVCYSMMQELATWLNYRNLRRVVNKEDPALDKLLRYIMVDERAHYDFFSRLVQMHLEEDREGTLEQLRRVVHTFAMPALHMMADGRQQMNRIRELGLFDDKIFYQEVYLPILKDLGIDRHEMRMRKKRELVKTT